ncbi:TPA: hypothetical protein ACPSKB_000644 [Legionella feeleii]
MPFRIDVPSPNGESHQAPTQAYQDYLDDVEKYGNIFGPFKGDMYTPARLYLSVTRQSITWSMVAPLEHDYTSQKWRNEVYSTAGLGHREISEGCVGYYRGTNSLHVKRQHQTANEAAHNHNHYRFNTDVTPELLAQHLRNFVKHDKASTHNGSSLSGVPKFLTSIDAERIIEAYTLCYQEEVRTGLKKELEDDPYYQYTKEDRDELREGLEIEGTCRDMSKSLEHTMVGLRYDRAEERQHKDTPLSVLHSRQIYAERSKKLEAIRAEREAFAKEFYAEKVDADIQDVPRQTSASTSEVFSPETVTQLKKSSLAGFFNKKPLEKPVASVMSQGVASQGNSGAFATETVSTLKKSKLAGFFNRPGASLDDVPDTFQSTVEELAREDDTNVQLPVLERSNDDNSSHQGTRGMTETVTIYS